MTDITVESMKISPDVLQTIAAIAATEVDGVVKVVAPAGRSFRFLAGKKMPLQGVEVANDADGKVRASIHLQVKNDAVLPTVAAEVRQAVVDAAAAQLGVVIDIVDVYIDAVSFE